MNAITKGEWRVTTFQLRDRLAILIGAHDNDDTPHTVITEIKIYPGFEDAERLADARLMAASPALLAALKDVLPWLLTSCAAGRIESDVKILRTVQAAIDAAEVNGK